MHGNKHFQNNSWLEIKESVIILLNEHSSVASKSLPLVLFPKFYKVVLRYAVNNFRIPLFLDLSNKRIFEFFCDVIMNWIFQLYSHFYFQEAIKLYHPWFSQLVTERDSLHLFYSYLPHTETNTFAIVFYYHRSNCPSTPVD